MLFCLPWTCRQNNILYFIPFFAVTGVGLPWSIDPAVVAAGTLAQWDATCSAQVIQHGAWKWSSVTALKHMVWMSVRVCVYVCVSVCCTCRAEASVDTVVVTGVAGLWVGAGISTRTPTLSVLHLVRTRFPCEYISCFHHLTYVTLWFTFKTLIHIHLTNNTIFCIWFFSP